MLANKLILIFFLGLLAFNSKLFASNCTGRSIYLNGVDISGSQNQELQKVDILINEKGDIYITAPQYEVFEEDHYLPLSKFLRSDSNLEHSGLQPLKHNRDMRKGGQAKTGELPRAPSSEIPRASTLKGLKEKATELTIPPPPSSQSESIPSKIGAKSRVQ